MISSQVKFILTITIFWASSCVAQQSSSIKPYPLVREEQSLVVNGRKEIWRLLWKKKPKPFCQLEDEAGTCPCTGFAYGETGDLFIVRFRNGKEIERLRLSPFFDGNEAILQLWPFDSENGGETTRPIGSSQTLRKPQSTKVMHFADYDHDGNPTEFYLQTESLPCGKSDGIVVGVSRDNPQLHVFGTASKPSQALYLQKREWEALRDTKSHEVDIIDWVCFDHGDEDQTELHLTWSEHGIDGTQSLYACTEKGKRGRLIRQGSLTDRLR